MPRARGIRLTPWITRRGPANVELPNVSHDCYNLKSSFKGSGGFERCPVRTSSICDGQKPSHVRPGVQPFDLLIRCLTGRQLLRKRQDRVSGTRDTMGTRATPERQK